MKKIVVSNIYGKFNLGDQAIRNSALKLLSELYPNYHAVLLCEDIIDFPINRDVNLQLTESYAPYGYNIRPHLHKAAPRIIKLIRLVFVLGVCLALCLIGFISQSLLPKRGFYSFIYHTKTAEVFFLMGGGYLVTRNHIKDTLGLIMNVLPLFVAKLFKKKIVILPISYGPYFNNVHQSVADLAIKDTHTICRDDISLQLAKQAEKDALFFPDLALYEWPIFSTKEESRYFVLTVKNYYELSKQIPIEKEFSKFVDYVWDTYSLKCVFIPTAANPIEENDIPSGERIGKDIKKGIFKIEIPKTPEETVKIISKAKFAVCTRMHSAIFSALAYTPFIAIAYEHKVTGFMKYMELEQWNTGMVDVSFEKLKRLSDLLIKKDTQKKYVEHLKYRREVILLQRNKLKNYIVNSTR